jgi:hypothetical protein
MAPVIGYTRSLVDAHEQPLATSPVRYTLAGSTRLEIEDLPGEWLKVTPRQMKGFADAFIQRTDLLIPGKLFTASTPVAIGTHMMQPLPDSVKAAAFAAWLTGPDIRPDWIDQVSWNTMLPDDQQQIFNILHNALHSCTDTWNNWFASVKADQRENDADIAEFRCFLAGGRYVFSILETQARKEPKANSIHVGRISVEDILLFTGRIEREPGVPPTDWAEISLRKNSVDIQGWVKLSYLDSYIPPMPSTDTTVPGNKDRVFDMTVPVLRPAQDQEILDNMNNNRVAQYIDVFKVTNKHTRHLNLCGEICTTVILSQDVLPTLAAWKAGTPSSPHCTETSTEANCVLDDPHEGTTLGQLKQILTVHNHPSGEILRFDPSISPISAARIRDLTNNRQVIITGCGINNSGKIVPFIQSATPPIIAHWVVIVDALPVGTSGWVRVYNPFRNREEVVELNLLKSSMLTLRNYLITERC